MTYKKKKLSGVKIVFGIIFALLFIITCYLQFSKTGGFDQTVLQYATIAELGICLMLLLPTYKSDIKQNKTKLSKRTIVSALLVLIAIPITLYIGTYFLANTKYYFISLLIILEICVPFFLHFEKRKPRAREIVIISVLCAIAVASRTAFYALPQFKPLLAAIILAGVCFGGETGFLVGAISAFVSNFFFGQWAGTPWQMFAFGIVGFLAGIIFQKGILRKNKICLCIYGAIATLIIYGGIMNPISLVLWQPNPTIEMIISSMVMGLPFDLLHAFATVFFLWFVSEPMIDKFERVKMKYGL